MKRLLWMMIVAPLLSCGTNATYDEYGNNDLELVTAYTAKDFCSCLFVQGQTEAYCKAWTAASPAVARIRVDERRRSVSTSAVVLWTATAVFVDEDVGCVLEE